VRNGQGFARLVKHAERLRSGPLFRTGQIIEEAQLWPTPDFPLVPLVIEYAGTTKTDDAGRPVRGHNRGRDIHVLWQYDRKSEERVWVKLCETEVGGSEWERIFRPLIADIIELPELNEEERGWDAANEALAAALEKLVDLPTDKALAIALGRFHDIATAAVVDHTHKLSDRARLIAAGDALATLHRPPERVTVSAEPPRSLRKSAKEDPVIDWDELRRILKPAGRALKPDGSDAAAADASETLPKKRSRYRRRREEIPAVTPPASFPELPEVAITPAGDQSVRDWAPERARKQGTKRGRPRAAVSTEWVMELHRDDLSLREIAERTGVSYTTVHRILKTQAAAEAPATLRKPPGRAMEPARANSAKA